MAPRCLTAAGGLWNLSHEDVAVLLSPQCCGRHTTNNFQAPRAQPIRLDDGLSDSLLLRHDSSLPTDRGCQSLLGVNGIGISLIMCSSFLSHHRAIIRQTALRHPASPPSYLDQVAPRSHLWRSPGSGGSPRASGVRRLESRPERCRRDKRCDRRR